MDTGTARMAPPSSPEDFAEYRRLVEQVSPDLTAMQDNGKWAVRKPNFRRPTGELDNRFMANARQLLLVCLHHIEQLEKKIQELQISLSTQSLCAREWMEAQKKEHEARVLAETRLEAAFRCMTIRTPKDPDYNLERQRLHQKIKELTDAELLKLVPPVEIRPEQHFTSAEPAIQDLHRTPQDSAAKPPFVEIVAYETCGVLAMTVYEWFMSELVSIQGWLETVLSPARQCPEPLRDIVRDALTDVLGVVKFPGSKSLQEVRQVGERLLLLFSRMQGGDDAFLQEKRLHQDRLQHLVSFREK